MSVVTVPSASIPNTKTRLGEPVESEKFRMRRLRIRQWEQEQVLEDMAAVRMIQQLRDSSIVPSSSVKTEFSDLDGMTWGRSAHRARSLLDHWHAHRTVYPLPKSTSLTLPPSSRDFGLNDLTIAPSITYDGLPSGPPTATYSSSLVSPLTPTPMLDAIFGPLDAAAPPQHESHAQPSPQAVSPGRNPAPVPLALCENETIRPSASSQPNATAPASLTSLHYFHLTRKQCNVNAASSSLSSIPAVTRPKRVRSHGVALPLRVQRDLTVRQSMFKARSGSKSNAAARKMQREPGGIGKEDLEGIDGIVAFIERNAGTL